MNSKNIIKDALELSPTERVFIIETLSNSLSEHNKNIEKFWTKEVEKRYKDFIGGKIKICSECHFDQREKSMF